MLEFAVFGVCLAILLVVASRRGTRHLEGKRLMTVLMSAGWLAGISVYAMPTTAVSSGLDAASVLCGLIGLFVGRLLARVAQAWYLAHRGWEEKDPESPPRLLHPWIAIGLFITGIPVLFGWAASRHEALEYANTPRHPESDALAGILRGGEALALEPDAPTDHAVLLLHGYLSTPSVFGDLPEALRKAGFAVHAPLLPGHGTRPDDLIGVAQEDWRKATAEAWRDLDERYDRVSVVGFSLGAALALVEVAEHEPYRIVLVNPYLGRITTPGWLPFEVDDAIPVVARLTPRVIRPDAFARLEKRENLERLVTYRTVPLSSAVELQRLGAEVRDFAAGSLGAPTLILSSVLDRAASPESVDAFHEALTRGSPNHERVRFERSDHLLYLDHDAEEAVRGTVAWLTGSHPPGPPAPAPDGPSDGDTEGTDGD